MIAKRCGALVFVAAFLTAGLNAHAASLNCAPDESHRAPSILGHQAAEDYDRPVSLKLLFPNILCDQKAIWLFPTKVASNGNWIPTISIVGASAGLIALDPVEGRYFHQTSAFADFNSALGGSATAVATVLVPATLYAVGSLRKDSKMQNTALLGAEAVADAEIVSLVVKDFTRRERPEAFQRNGNYWDSWFEKGGGFFRGAGSFPSGHAVAAFSIATVVAHRYRNHRWVPYVAYGAAALAGFSRLTGSAHFGSDVFVGAALGYAVSRFAVLRY